MYPKLKNNLSTHVYNRNNKFMKTDNFKPSLIFESSTDKWRKN